MNRKLITRDLRNKDEGRVSTSKFNNRYTSDIGPKTITFRVTVSHSSFIKKFITRYFYLKNSYLPNTNWNSYCTSWNLANSNMNLEDTNWYEVDTSWKIVNSNWYPPFSNWYQVNYNCNLEGTNCNLEGSNTNEVNSRWKTINTNWNPPFTNLNLANSNMNLEDTNTNLEDTNWNFQDTNWYELYSRWEKVYSNWKKVYTSWKILNTKWYQPISDGINNFFNLHKKTPRLKNKPSIIKEVKTYCQKVYHRWTTIISNYRLRIFNRTIPLTRCYLIIPNYFIMNINFIERIHDCKIFDSS